jgi:hypothetical protein
MWQLAKTDCMGWQTLTLHLLADIALNTLQPHQGTFASFSSHFRYLICDPPLRLRWYYLHEDGELGWTHLSRMIY